jgi:hypothetical protein
MSVDLPSTLITAVVSLGVAAVPLLIYLFSRRAQLRALDTTSDATQITAAATFVAMLQDQIKALTLKLEKAESTASTDRTNFTEQLTRAHDENSRMAGICAVLRTDLDIANRQIEELRASGRTRMDIIESKLSSTALDEGVAEIKKADPGP